MTEADEGKRAKEQPEIAQRDIEITLDGEQVQDDEEKPSRDDIIENARFQSYAEQNLTAGENHIAWTTRRLCRDGL